MKRVAKIARPFGSSPHARGTLRGGDRMRGHTRFIPACAGNAPPPSARNGSASVHPRMRGERLIQRRARTSSHGSSPHARGTPCYETLDIWRQRFIPACAGNATIVDLNRRGISVHPRMRGERHQRVSVFVLDTGSSPHARGTHWCDEQSPATGRFIPACAGNARDRS